ncbi:MAG: triose-phosphate isomerase [Nitrospirae bacterium]|nr:MAG: triose-phosphate isomerase [Nitrospirota bacterium]
MRRHRLIVGNWKMHKTIPEAVDFLGQLTELLTRGEYEPSTGVKVVIAPPFTALSAVAAALGTLPFLLGAQDLHWEDQGAFTGEISGGMLADIGCRYVIVGHSERRRYFGDTDGIVQKKAAAALRHGLHPIVCIGESLDQRLSGQTEHLLSTQLTESLAAVSKEQAQDVVIAYEPVWAIGSGHPATPEQAHDAHRHIRTLLIALWGEDAGERVPILYGGSVVPENTRNLLVTPYIDGALVGGACLNPVLFAKILAVAGSLN